MWNFSVIKTNFSPLIVSLGIRTKETIKSQQAQGEALGHEDGALRALLWISKIDYETKGTSNGSRAKS